MASHGSGEAECPGINNTRREDKTKGGLKTTLDHNQISSFPCGPHYTTVKEQQFQACFRSIYSLYH